MNYEELTMEELNALLDNNARIAKTASYPAMIKYYEEKEFEIINQIKKLHNEPKGQIQLAE